jgi:hypothetical protein
MYTRKIAIAALMLGAGSASGQLSIWNNPAGGNWNDALNWSTASIPNAAGATARLPSLAGSYDVLCNLNASVDGILIDGASQRLIVDGNRTLSILGAAGIENHGEVVINPSMSVFDTAINFSSSSGTTSLFGSGQVILNGGGSPNDARIRVIAGTALTLAQPVRGVGRILSDGSTDNQSSIEADVEDMVLQITGTVNQSGSGSMEGLDGGLLTLNQATVTGGRFLGGVHVTDLSTISNVILTGDNSVFGNEVLSIDAPGIQNNGVLTINTEGNVFNAFLNTAAATTISGSGSIDLNGAGADVADAQIIAVAGNPLTIGANQTITGNGRIDANAETITLLGIVLADRAGQDLVMRGTLDFDSSGRIQSAGGIALLAAATVSDAQLQGDVDASAGSVLVDSFNSGTFRVRSNSTVFIENTFRNSSAVVVNHDNTVFNAILRASVDTEILDSGTITLNATAGDIADAQIDVDAGMTLTVGAGQVIDGTGRVDSLGTTIMNGIYRGNVAGLDLRLEGAHDLTGGGQAEGTGGGFATFRDADVTGGEFLGGVHTMATTTMHGFINSGSMAVRNNSTLSVDMDFTNNSIITVNDNASVFNSALTATQPVTINGTGTIVLNGEGSDPADAQLDANQALGGSLNIPAAQTIIGRGEIDGPATLHGMVSGGTDDLAAGTIRFSDEVNLMPRSSIVLDFFEDMGNVTFDNIVGNSTLTLDGTIELRLQGGFEPAIGDRFTIVDAGTVTGVFATTDTPLIGTHLFRVIENAGDVEALWTCLGDVNLDGALTPTDFTAWIAAFNSGNVEVGDQNLDGSLTPTDFTAWIINFNAGC